MKRPGGKAIRATHASGGARPRGSRDTSETWSLGQTSEKRELAQKAQPRTCTAAIFHKLELPKHEYLCYISLWSDNARQLGGVTRVDLN